MIQKNYLHYKLSLTLTFFLLIFLYLKFFYSSFVIVPETDEVVTISTFLDYRTVFLKYLPNNHVISSLFGMISTQIFGLKLIILRTISFMCLF